jgi:hypothetical protein
MRVGGEFIGAGAEIYGDAQTPGHKSCLARRQEKNPERNRRLGFESLPQLRLFEN